MWIPAQTTMPSGASTLERLRDERAGRSEDDRGVEWLGRRLVAASRPGRPEAPGELLGALVAGAREREHLASLEDGDLADHVRRRAEAVEARAAARRR